MMHMSTANKQINKSILFITTVLGELSVMACLGHAVFEICKGNEKSIDIATTMGAFTIFPTYILAGSITSMLSIFLGFWIFVGLKKKLGRLIVIILSTLLFLSGGGVAPIFGLFLSFCISLLMYKQSEIKHKQLLAFGGNSWKILFGTGFGLLMIGILYWLFITPPGETYTITYKTYIDWAFLICGTIVFIISVFLAFIHDSMIKTSNRV